MKKIGVLTIGQSPRIDVTPLIKQLLDESIQIVERGALDSLTEEEIQSIQPKEGDVTYISRLRNGQSTKISKAKLLPLLQRELSMLEKEVNIILLLCTGDFPTIESEKLIFFPDKLLVYVMNAVMKKGKLGIIIPLEEQRKSLMEKWQALSIPIAVEVASPYTSSDIQSASLRLKNQGVTSIVLDCMGYQQKHKEAVVEATSLPVVLSITLSARILSEYL